MTTLTAPIRRLGQTVRILAALTLAMPRVAVSPVTRGRRPRRPPWPQDEGGGGVREPRRPKRTPPTGAIALPEPEARPTTPGR
jgi:hypothetical protein